MPVVTLLAALLTAPGCKKNENVQRDPLFVGPIAAVVDLPVSFYSTAQAGDKVLWEFGDGATSTELQPQHIYSSMGTFSVRLTANGVLVITTATVYNLPDSLSLAAFTGRRYWHGTKRWYGPPGPSTVSFSDTVELKIIDRATLCINRDTFRLNSINDAEKYYYFIAYYNSEVTKGGVVMPVDWNYLKFYFEENKLTWSNHPFYQHLYGNTEAPGTTTELTTP